MPLSRRECVLCRAFRQGLGEEECDRDCNHLNLTLLEELAHLPQENHNAGLHRCKERDVDGCWVHFLYQAEHRNQSAHIHVALERGKLIDLHASRPPAPPRPPDAVQCCNAPFPLYVWNQATPSWS